MPLNAGTAIGPYVVLGPLGAGGMGEVYRARDGRLSRDVALKIITSAREQDRDAVERFEREARAVAALSHPNIVSIFEFGHHEGCPYAAMELLEGGTLRTRLGAGPLAPRRAREYALQIAAALAAAHDSGIVHRDLKPENVFVTRDDRVKLLDFGLAKKQVADLTLSMSTASSLTAPGTILGTLGYMSPEQVRGEPLDHRSDIFSFGAVLYEMLTGCRAFQRNTPAATLAAILRDEPPDPPQPHNYPLALDRIVGRCLAKGRADRFQATRDLVFALEALSDSSGRQAAAPSPTVPVYRRVTYRRGHVVSARFAGDAHTVVFGGAWDGLPVELYATRLDNPESRALGFKTATVLSVSRAGEMAVSLGYETSSIQGGTGTLAKMPVVGAVPREILEDVVAADWLPDSKQLLVIRRTASGQRLEWPIGTIAYETSGALSHARVSPRGDRVAFIEHPLNLDTAGSVLTIDAQRAVTALTAGWGDAAGLAWSPRGDEVWFTAARVGEPRALYSVSLAGQERLLSVVPGDLTIEDVAPDGTVLVKHSNDRLGMIGRLHGEEQERDLSWLAGSGPAGLSPDGKTLLFVEGSQGAGPDYCTYLRKAGREAAVRLGDGLPLALSPDARWALVMLLQRPQLVLLPTGAGEPRIIHEGFAYHPAGAAWLPDGSAVLFSAACRQTRLRSYLLATGEAAPPREITPEDVIVHAVAPDGRRAVGCGVALPPHVFPIDGSGPPEAVRGLELGDEPVQWSADGEWLYFHRPGRVPGELRRVNLASGTVEAWRPAMPPDGAGVTLIDRMRITPDGRHYVYRYRRELTDLYVIHGLA